MKKGALFIGLVASFMLCFGQTKQKDTIQLKKVLELKINFEGGANGAGVAFHPGLKRYYCAMAGNAQFPMVVFDATGKLLSDSSLTTLIDVRGIWYNPAGKTIQANGYSDYGWISYNLNAKGVPESFTQLFEGMNQPTEQSVGAFDPVNNVLYFLDDTEDLLLFKYKLADGMMENESIFLHFGQNKEEEIDEELEVMAMFDYNLTSPVYTRIPKSEIGLLNINLNQIELYDLDKALLTKVLLLPENAPVNEMFNFSYCNGIYWLFDKDERKWIGYR